MPTAVDTHLSIGNEHCSPRLPTNPGQHLLGSQPSSDPGHTRSPDPGHMLSPDPGPVLNSDPGPLLNSDPGQSHNPYWTPALGPALSAEDTAAQAE